MKLTTDNKAQDFGHKKFQFKIDEKHAMKAIWALINLYKHKIQTPVQEIISNARDAHREVGKPDHTFDVKVTDTQFIVRDYGSGIDPQKADTIYCSIGATTKGNDNTQTGGHGLGAKSPLAYTKQFEMISYVDGTKYHYMIAKNGELLEMNVVSTEKTKLENGTKVIIPIKTTKDGWGRSESDKNKFIHAVRRCCYFWENRPSFNHEIKPLELFKLKGMDNNGYYKSDVVNGELAVIDGIPYKASGAWNSPNKVVFFNTGDIRVHETRERLADSSEDIEYNYKKIHAELDKIKNHVKTEINTYVDSKDFFGSFKKLNYFGIPFNYRHMDLVFKNMFICNENDSSFEVYEVKQGSRYPYNRRYKKERYGRLTYDTEIYYNDLGDSTAKVSRRVKGYLQQFVTDQKEKVVHVTNSRGMANIFKAKNLSTLELPKINRNGAKKQNEEITVTVLGKYGQDRYYFRLNNVSRKFVYVPYNVEVEDNMREFLEYKGFKVCKLSKESIGRVQDHEKFTEYKEYVDSYELTEREINSIYRSKLDGCSMNVNFTEVIDPKIKRLAEIDSYYSHELTSYKVPEIFHTMEVTKELVKIHDYNVEISDIRVHVGREYPLLRYDNKDNTEYINALYNYRRK